MVRREAEYDVEGVPTGSTRVTIDPRSIRTFRKLLCGFVAALGFFFLAFAFLAVVATSPILLGILVMATLAGILALL